MFDQADAFSLFLSLFAATPTSFVVAILSRDGRTCKIRAGEKGRRGIAPFFLKLGHHNALFYTIYNAVAIADEERHRRFLLRRRPRVNPILARFCVSSASRPINYTPAEIYRAREREKPRSERYSRRSFFAAVIARCRLLIASTHWLAAGEVTDWRIVPESDENARKQ